MSLLDRLFRRKDNTSSNTLPPDEPKSHQLPSSIVANEFGEVNVLINGSTAEIDLTILMEPQGVEAEGWQTGVALDSSASMKNWFGQMLNGKVPDHILSEYEKNGWLTTTTQDGRKFRSFKKEGYNDAINNGYLKVSENIVQPLARQFIGYLAGNLDADGGTTVIYWACGDGSIIEELGDYTQAECTNIEFTGPKTKSFGNSTNLTPAVKYFVDRFVDAKRGMYLFVTDGKIDDLENVKKYTTQIAKEIEAGTRNSVKCVLIGVGSEVDIDQMEQLDDLDTGTDVDIWDHKIASELRGLVEIFAEVVSENQIVAASGTIYDSNNNVVKRYTDGLPAKLSFEIPSSNLWFELEVGGNRIRQKIR